MGFQTAGIQGEIDERNRYREQLLSAPLDKITIIKKEWAGTENKIMPYIKTELRNTKDVKSSLGKRHYKINGIINYELDYAINCIYNSHKW